MTLEQLEKLANGWPFKRDWHAFAVLAVLYMLAASIAPLCGA
ncbi:hypothetical protein PSP6_160103 [Paraburkholderia tropica]|nr:hypothetical protein [Paraburkholderia tropica]CAG9195777.1 hypothetical protein PSP6_160103 [Paraburkholderia tropica]